MIELCKKKNSTRDHAASCVKECLIIKFLCDGPLGTTCQQQQTPHRQREGKASFACKLKLGDWEALFLHEPELSGNCSVFFIRIVKALRNECKVQMAFCCNTWKSCRNDVRNGGCNLKRKTLNKGKQKLRQGQKKLLERVAPLTALIPGADLTRPDLKPGWVMRPLQGS